MAGYVAPDYVEPGYVEMDDVVTPPLIPSVSLTSGRLGATIMGAVGAFDIPYLTMAAIALVTAGWRLVRAFGAWSRRAAGSPAMTPGGARAG